MPHDHSTSSTDSTSRNCLGQRGSLPGPADLHGSTEHLVDIVGDGLVLEWHGVRGIAQRGRGIPVSEALLCLQQLAPSDEEGGHAVAQAMQGGPRDLGPPGEFGEPVPEDARGEPELVGGLRGEQPWAEDGAVGKPSGPGLRARMPQLDRLAPESQAARRPVLVGPSTSAETPRSIAF